MKFNQFSYIPVSPEIACQELRSLGFEVSLDASAKANFESFVRKHFLFFEDTDLALKNWISDPETDLLAFFQSLLMVALTTCTSCWQHAHSLAIP